LHHGAFGLKEMKILLMGNPNVGKSVIFSRLTGVRVISSNYPGTTVTYTRGHMKMGQQVVEVIDVPGTLTLEPASEAEQVALRMLDSGDMIINVVDATNLERNLYLTLQLLERNKPVIVALNMWDDTGHRGINIDLEKLRADLAVPVIPTVAVSGEGIKEMVQSVPLAVAPNLTERTRYERWAEIGQIINDVQTITHRHHTWFESLADASVRPWSGSFIAVAILLASFFTIRFIGEGLINYVFNPLFENFWTPVLNNISRLLGGTGLLHDMVIGKMIDGQVDFVQSFGLLSSGLYVPIAMVLPYIVSFYFMFGILEDVGYLPRLAVLMDTLMHRLGLHGYAIIPTLLGLGCNVPAILATRILESQRERFITATLISIALPCAALQAMILGFVGERGIQYIAIIYGALFMVWIVLGIALRYTVKGFSPELLIEIPPYRFPPWQIILQKLWIRTSAFLLEAIPIILGAILVINLLYTLGVFTGIADFMAPVITGLFGLPQDAVAPLIIGFLRKDVAMGLLAPLALSSKQLVIGSVVLTMFFPCIATFVVFFKELGLINTLKSTAIMIASVLVVGTLLNLVLPYSI
jgi:ferrous iron transport protein B